LGKDSNIKATTGFQSRNYSLNELETQFREVLGRDDKTMEFAQTSFRSALDIYKGGGHVTKVYKDQVFRLMFDNRRIIQDSGLGKIDASKVLLDSKPVPDAETSRSLRAMSKMYKQRTYNKESSIRSGNKYKDYTELAVRNFIKGLLSKPVMYNLEGTLNSYTEIIEFIKEYDNNIKVSKQSISNLKNRKMIFKSVPRTKDTLRFVEYVKSKIERFDDRNFLD
jgi:hypothetical protein